MTNLTCTVTFDATFSTAIVPANRLAVAPAVFSRLACESEHPAGIDGLDQLHITTGTDDADLLDALAGKALGARKDIDGVRLATLVTRWQASLPQILLPPLQRPRGARNSPTAERSWGRLREET